MNTLYGLLKFIVGFFLALVLIAGATVAGALYFAAKLQEPPAKPIFPNDKSVKKTTPTAAKKPGSSATPKPTPSTETLEPGAYRAVVVQPIGLVLRDTPSQNANRIGGISYQEEIVVLEEAKDKTWQRVRVVGDPARQGWVVGGNTEPIEKKN